MDEPSPVKDTNTRGEDHVDPALRPVSLGEFAGQSRIKRSLNVAIEAARGRGEPLDHVLFSGPPGLGKTTLARIVAEEMRYAFVSTSAPALTRPGDLAAILSGLPEFTVLFVDECHRLTGATGEMLYTAMEDRRIDILIGEGTQAKSVSLDLPVFTLVGATTRAGSLPGPLRDRFGMALKLEFYEVAELLDVLEREVGLLGIGAEKEALGEIARSARGTPRIAKRLLRRVRDHAEVEGDGRIDCDITARALADHGIDERGLDRQDRDYLETIARNFNGGPVGVETLAATLAEDRDTLEDAVEPFLLQLGYLQRTPRGRVMTAPGFAAIGWPRRAMPPAVSGAQGAE